MANYNTIRLKKIKSISQAKQAQAHNFRLHKKLSNVDYGKTDENVYLVGQNEDLTLQFELLRQQYKFKFDAQRQNMFDEFVISASPEFFKGKSKEQTIDYFQKHIDFLKREYFKVNGSIISAVIHFDEKTPHMHLIASPLILQKKEIKRGKDKGKVIEKVKLSHSELFGGTGGKVKLRKLQDKANQYLNEQGYKLNRGKSKEITKKSHKTTFEHLRKLEEKFEDYKNVKIDKQEKKLIKEMKEEYKNQKREHENSMLSKLTKFSIIKLNLDKFNEVMTLLVKVLNKNKKLEQELKFREDEFKQQNFELNNKENLLKKKLSNFEQYYKKAKQELEEQTKRLDGREATFELELIKQKNQYETKVKKLKQEIEEYEETLNEITDVFNYKPELEQAFYQARDQMYQARNEDVREMEQEFEQKNEATVQGYKY